MWFDLFEDVHYNLDVIFTKWFLFYGTSFIERHIQKIHLLIRYSHISSSRFCFSPSDPHVYPQLFFAINLFWAFFPDRLNYYFLQLGTITPAQSELLIEVAHEVSKTNCIIIKYSNVS